MVRETYFVFNGLRTGIEILVPRFPTKVLRMIVIATLRKLALDYTREGPRRLIKYGSLLRETVQ